MSKTLTKIHWPRRVAEGSTPVCSDVWLAGSSREPWLGGDGASLKAHGGKRTVKCQTHMGKDKWHRLRGGLPR